MQKIGLWQRFRPKLKGRLDDETLYEPGSLYAQARVIVDDALHHARSDRAGLKRTKTAARQLRQRQFYDAAHFVALIILQTPGAARAQKAMDKHHGGYENRQARVFELIDFNDTFVDAVLALAEKELNDFTERLWSEMQTFCAQQRLDCFTEDEYRAIVHGLSREIAVFRAAKKCGYEARMTSRLQDSKGVDMIITDPETKKSLAIDIKTSAAFHWRIVDLKKRGRLNEEQHLECELAGFCKLAHHKNDNNRYEPLLLRISTSRLGEIKNFDFVTFDAFHELLRSAFQYHGEYMV